jgi:hypothetical protein
MKERWVSILASRISTLVSWFYADSGEAGPAFRLMPGYRSGACRAGGRETGNALSLRW